MGRWYLASPWSARSVNVGAAAVLARANRTSLNVQGAYAHVVTDLYAFVGTAFAGLVILLTGWERADPIASLLVVARHGPDGLGLAGRRRADLLQAAPDDLAPGRRQGGPG